MKHLILTLCLLISLSSSAWAAEEKCNCWMGDKSRGGLAGDCPLKKHRRVLNFSFIVVPHKIVHEDFAEEVTAYKAKDGTLFESKEKAETHQGHLDEIRRKRAAKNALESFFLKNDGPDLDHHSWNRLVEKCHFIAFYSDEIYRILKSFREPKKKGELDVLEPYTCPFCKKTVMHWFQVLERPTGGQK